MDPAKRRRGSDRRLLAAGAILVLALQAPGGEPPAGEPPARAEAPEAGLTVSGRVVDEDGAPVVGAEVWVLDLPWRPPGEGVRTAEDGSFRVTGLAPGTWRVEVVAPERYQADPDATIELLESLYGLEVRMLGGAVIAGRILGFQPADAGRLRVAVAPRRPGGSWIDGEIDGEGGYRVAGVPPGAWRVNVSFDQGGGPTTNVPIDLAAGERQARLDVLYRGPLTLGGRVTLGGEPAADVWILLSHLASTLTAQTHTGAAGEFRVAGLPAGRYGLAFTSFDPPLTHRRELDLEADREVTIELPAHAVTGRVVDATTGAPIGGASVRLVPKGSGGGGKGGVASAESDGGFRVPRVAPGEYVLHAERTGFATVRRELTVGPEAGAGAVEVALSPALEAVLEVASTTGVPPRHVEVVLLDPADAAPPADAPVVRGVAGGRLRPDERGRVHLDGVPAGRWLALVSAPWMAVASVDLAVPGPPVAVLLAPQATIELTVPRLDEVGRARLLGADGRLLLLPFRDTADTASPAGPGRVRLVHVPAGTWTIEVTARDGRSWTGRVTAVEGEVVEASLEERSPETP